MDKDSEMPTVVEGEVVDPSPRQGNGDVMLRDSKGRFLPGQQPPAMIRSSEQASSMARRRHELAAQAARKALASKALAQGLNASPVAAYGYLAGEMYDSSLANVMDKPREAVDAGKFALRLAGMLPADDKQAVAVAVQVNVGGELLRAWAPGAIEGAWSDTSPRQGDRDAD